jgi:hypothetical protein
MILFTGMYNTTAEDGTLTVNNLEGIEVGPGFTQAAIDSVIPGLVALKDYERQKKQGLDPVFDPQALGIKDADFWENDYRKSDNERISQVINHSKRGGSKNFIWPAFLLNRTNVKYMGILAELVIKKEVHRAVIHSDQIF